MSKAAKAYVYLIISLGLVATLSVALQYRQFIIEAHPCAEFGPMLCLVLLCAICRSLPIYINPNFALDVSILSIVAAALTRGPAVAVMVYLFSSVITIDTNGPVRHIFNMSPLKTAFNNAMMVLAILLPGMLIERMGFVPGKLVLPDVLWPMIVFTSLAFLINYSLLFVLYLATGQAKPRSALQQLVGLLPNVLAAMPLGLFTALLFTSEYGHWMAVIMLLPLLLARYAWKLFVDAQQQYYRLVNAFISSMEAKDTYTEGHSRRVNQYSILIARAMKLKPAEENTIRSAALLHDIGKIGIPDAILTKPDRLTDEEYAQIKRHPEIGVGIVERVRLPKDVVEIIRHHHERFDGTGYPDGLSHADLSTGAQILAIADAYDAMTSHRPYRFGLPREVAIEELVKGKGTQFNPALVDLFVAALEELGEDGKLPDGEMQ